MIHCLKVVPVLLVLQSTESTCVGQLLAIERWKAVSRSGKPNRRGSYLTEKFIRSNSDGLPVDFTLHDVRPIWATGRESMVAKLM